MRDRLSIGQPPCPCNRFSKIDAPGVEVVLVLRHAPSANGAQRDKSLLLPVDIDPVSRLDINIVLRIHDQILKWNRHAPFTALENNPGFITLASNAAGPR